MKNKDECDCRYGSCEDCQSPSNADLFFVKREALAFIDREAIIYGHMNGINIYFHKEGLKLTLESDE